MKNKFFTFIHKKKRQSKDKSHPTNSTISIQNTTNESTLKH